MAEPIGMGLGHAVALLAAAVVAVPLFKRFGLGAVLGYLAAGLVIGPFGLGVIEDAESVLHVAELGVVMFLFIIGLEMRPARLWSLRREIFGLGLLQVVTCGALLTGVALLFGLPGPAAVIAGAGFALSSTAIVMQLLEERNENNETDGQRVVSILLFEDLAIVPLLALVAVLGGIYGTAIEDPQPIWLTVGFAVAAVAAVYAIGKWVLNPVFRILAQYGGREVMTAGALLVVLGAAWAMDLGGLSMAMGAFLAGVLLSESTFRHQLEADVEPFRGILLGLFFLSVGMSLDLQVVIADWPLVLGGVAAFMGAKMAGVYGIARIKAAHGEALKRAALMGEGGEFAFVLYGAALTAGLFEPRMGAILSAVVIVSMALTPLRMLLADRFKPREDVSMEGVDHARNLRERVLIIGFGRFAQVVAQPLLARDVDVSIIENDVEMIQAAGNFGFKVYYGDGSRLDVLRASGAADAETVLVCVDKPEVADRIVELMKSEFPLTKLFVRAYDRGHSIRLIEAGVEYHIRETFESALVFGEQVLVDLGFNAADARETIEDVRRRDEERLTLQVSGGLQAGRNLMRGNMVTPQPAPYVKPRRESRPLNEEAADVLEETRDRV
ncbi:monovalent cation:proton antiporter-2 (CPA2) family protein [Brevundimonas variabilis]|uniref:Glutathione-regulated potassium-efflux system protein KefB n=1 Tax=Brevundimonas variabilis TaxID=74312 RepID=A0A7W9FCR4_9CAUL|nr:monovalent cation:proton antiporter-2 (CPA2) family protein [Brevundimonas variabilis]MBB5744445.1 glutathione-regulated potassium-efflux system protein KefB [Brevundimonas variabilis]